MKSVFIRAMLGVMALVATMSGCAAQGYIAADAPETDTRAGEGMPPAPLSAKAAKDFTTPDEAKAPDVAPAGRIFIYSASLQLVVPRVADAIDSIRHLAEQMGGFLQEMDSSSITVRVPAARFTAAISSFEKLGEVTARNVKGVDITEEMLDLQIRLDNAEKMRVRLTAMLEKAVKMEDAIQIEKELQRITETIELLKGKIRYNQSQVAYSTIKVMVNSPVPQREIVDRIPFPWMRELGQGVVSGRISMNAEKGGWFEGGVRFELPPSYIRYHVEDDVTEAMSADGVMIKAQRRENFKGGDLSFWSTLARRAIVENRSISLEKETEVTLAGGGKAKVMIGTRDIGGKPSGYLLAIAVEQRHVYAFECWGPKDVFDRDRSMIEKAVGSMRVDR